MTVIKTVKLGDIVKISKGKKAISIFDTPNERKIRFIQIDDLRNDNNLKFTEDDGISVEADDVIIAWDGANAGTVGYGLSGIIGSTLAKLEIKNQEIIPQFLGKFLQGKFRYLRDRCTGATIPHINKTVLCELSIPILPLKVQKHIVARLDAADQLRRKRKQAIALLDEYLKAVFLEMFGDPVVNPNGWKVKILKDLTIKIGSGATPKGGKNAYKQKGISLIRSLNIHDNEFLYKDLAFIDDKQAENLRNVAVESEDILFNITGASVCRCTIIKDDILPARVNQHVCIIRCRKTILNPKYLLYVILFPSYKQKLINIATAGGATREAITKLQIEDFKIPVPPIALQDRFAEAVKKIELLKRKMIIQDGKLNTQFQALMQKSFI